MTGLSEDLGIADTPKDLSADELMQLKEVLLNFEKVFDEVEIKAEGISHDGDFLFEMLDKAGVRNKFIADCCVCNLLMFYLLCWLTCFNC